MRTPTGTRRGGPGRPPGWPAPGVRPRAEHTCASTRGSMLEKVPTAPDSLPTATRSRAARRRCTSRSTWRAQSANLAPKVVGSACIPWVRPVTGTSMDSRARALHTRTSPAAASTRRSAAPGQRGAQGRVDHVGRGQPVVDPRTLGLADGVLDDVDERGHVVVGHPLALGHRLHEGRVDHRGVRPAVRGGIGGHVADGHPAVGGEQLDRAATWRTGPRRRRVRPSPSGRSGGSSESLGLPTGTGCGPRGAGPGA